MLVKTSQNSVYYFQILSSTFWWKFHENPNKFSKLQMHENLHKNVNELHVFIPIFMQVFTSF